MAVGQTSEAFLGIAAIGLGALTLYGAVKNKAIFGAHGLLTTALSTGHFPDPSTVPPMFPSLVAGVAPVAPDPRGGTTQGGTQTDTGTGVPKGTPPVEGEGGPSSHA